MSSEKMNKTDIKQLKKCHCGGCDDCSIYETALKYCNDKKTIGDFHKYLIKFHCGEDYEFCADCAIPHQCEECHEKNKKKKK